MPFEDEDPEFIEWADEDLPKEEVPAALRKRWDAKNRRGVRASLCRVCGRPFTQEDLSCPTCDAPVQIHEAGYFTRFAQWLIRSRWGIAFFLAVVAALAAYLFAV